MNGDKVFLDTNIFIYMYTPSVPQKREVCLSIIDNYDCVTSTQALNEICNVLTKKIRTPIGDIRKVLADVNKICEVANVSQSIIFNALNINEKYGYSFYDCLIIAAALDSECNVLYTEDMQNGQVINGKLKIVNPFNGII